MGIRAAVDADLTRIGTTITQAFAVDPVMRWLYPDDHEYYSVAPLETARSARRYLATDSLWCTEDVVALSGWVPPGRPEVELPPSSVEVPAWRRERFDAIRAAMADHTPEEPHWYLNVLATHPHWQRQGLGAALMQPGFELADDMGLRCYLETETVANVAYYRHHGFEVRSEWDVPPDGPHMWGMLR